MYDTMDKVSDHLMCAANQENFRLFFQASRNVTRKQLGLDFTTTVSREILTCHPNE